MVPGSRNSDPGSHIAGSSPPSLLQFEPCIFIARRFQLFRLSSLVDLLRRTVLNHARRSQQLTFLQINPKSHHDGIRIHGPTLPIEAVEDYTYHYRPLGVDRWGGDRLLFFLHVFVMSLTKTHYADYSYQSCSDVISSPRMNPENK